MLSLECILVDESTFTQAGGDLQDQFSAEMGSGDDSVAFEHKQGQDHQAEQRDFGDSWRLAQAIFLSQENGSEEQTHQNGL